MRSLAVIAIGFLAWPGLCGCKSAGGLEDPRNETTAQSAANQFHREVFCPLEQVTARRIVPMPEPPTDIGADEDRAALWERTWKLRAMTDDRLIIEVTGCGSTTVYSCWEVAALSTNLNTTGRGKKTIVVGSACLHENGYVSAIAGR